MNESRLIEAAKTGDLNRVQSLINEGVDVDLEQKDNNGWTALNWAAGCGYSEIARILLEAGANVINKGRDLRTPYQISLAAAHVETAKLFQQAEKECGNSIDKTTSLYCKAYPVKALGSFVDWRRHKLNEDSVVYLHQDFSVTESNRHSENILLDQVSEAWLSYCRDQLKFCVPTDIELASVYRDQQTKA